ncbi:hypothetical protein GCM10023116_14030 [Kistimonas scapharcae]|uniref:Uncharacterized protein n=1 Tax=Kistimonas scapharcae TaxID=1036133 RepID=A0ABP8V0K8_9GAMM
MAVLSLRIDCDRKYFDVVPDMECQLGGSAGNGDPDWGFYFKLGVYYPASHFIA